MAVDVKRIQEVFLAALKAADPVQQAAILERECGSDTEMRQRVEALLGARQEPASILAPLAGAPPPPVEGAAAVDHSTDLEEATLLTPEAAPAPPHPGPEEVERRLTLAFLQPSTKAR